MEALQERFASRELLDIEKKFIKSIDEHDFLEIKFLLSVHPELINMIDKVNFQKIKY